MVYGFIKQSNGHIKIYSEPGHGTTIRMYLPRSNAPAAAEVPVAVPPCGRERVLMVEDDPNVAAVVRHQLESLGYAVCHATDGQAALDRLDADAFDLLLTDAIMPGGIKGQRLAEIAAARWPSMKIIFMSGYSEPAANFNRVAVGARLLAKPFRRLDLALALRQTLDG